MALSIDKMRLKGARLLCDKVRPAAEANQVSEGGLHIPQQSIRTRSSYGVRARVLAVGPKVVSDEIHPGSEVIIDEFAGRPIYDNARETNLWIVGESEVMVVLDGTP